MEQPPALPPSKRMRVWPLVVLILLAVGAFVGWRVYWEPRDPAEAAPAEDAGVAELDAGPPLSLEEGDALFKTLAGRWSSDGLVAQWLQAASLRHLVSATQLIAEGSSPRPALPFVSISGAFAVREEQGPLVRPVKRGKRKGLPPPPREERLFISAEGSARYGVITKAFGSLDAAAAGDAWSKLEPFCEVAFGEISRPGSRFHDALTAAVKRVLSVQVPEGEIEVVPKGAIYLFKDPALESLSPAEKQLLRMGPANVKVIQDQVRLFASHAQLD